MTLPPDKRRSRIEYEFEVCDAMNSSNHEITAHASREDAVRGRNAIKSVKDAARAEHYRYVAHIETLVGPGKYNSVTKTHIEISDPQYPFVKPRAWVIQDGVSRIPFSPHVYPEDGTWCLGSWWKADSLLGDVICHIARLLNWDETVDHGYVGWQPNAVKWWRDNLKGPLNRDLVLPIQPSRLTHDLHSTPHRGGMVIKTVGPASVTQGMKIGRPVVPVTGKMIIKL